MKKCSIAKVAASLGLLSWGATAFASPSAGEISRQVKQDLHHRQTIQFSELVKKWNKAYGTRAVAPLLVLARDHSQSDANRYIAVLGAAQLGGAATANSIAGLTTDSSWMIRLAALRALIAIHPSPVSPKVSASILNCSKDPALVVRSEAIDAIQSLKPTGAREALLRAVSDPANYHHGKAQWVPGKALVALAQLEGPSPEIAPRLAFLLDHREDPLLQRETLKTLQALTGRNIATSLPLNKQIQRWKSALASQ